MSETGQFTLFELVPVAELLDQLPAFCSRYDNGTNKVDTDIILDAIRTLDAQRKSNVTRDFKAKRRKYHGHHSDIVIPLRRYKLELRVSPTDFSAISDSGLIFDGEILLDRLVFDKNVTMAVRVGVSASVRVFDKGRERDNEPLTKRAGRTAGFFNDANLG
jgi:hypothetical protein